MVNKQCAAWHSLQHQRQVVSLRKSTDSISNNRERTVKKRGMDIRKWQTSVNYLISEIYYTGYQDIQRELIPDKRLFLIQ